MLVMTGRVTMLGISRWAGKGGSYRTVQRFFSTVIPWAIAVLGVLSSACVPSRGCLPAGWAMKSSSPKPASTPMAWIGSLPVCMASQCPGWPSSPCRLVSVQATALVPDARRAGRAQRRGESGQQGQSGSQAAQTVHAPSVALGVRRAARTNPKPTSRSRRSWCGSQACSTPCCT